MTIHTEPRTDEPGSEEPGTDEVHDLRRHPKGGAALVVGSSPEGSASCSCGRWSVALLNNRAGDEETKRSHLEHQVKELTTENRRLRRALNRHRGGQP